MDKKSDIIFYEKKIKEMNDNVFYYEALVELYKSVCNEDEIKTEIKEYEIFISDIKELINKYTNKLKELQVGDK